MTSDSLPAPEAYDAAANPATPAPRLWELAQHPQLAPLVAANPAAPAELKQAQAPQASAKDLPKKATKAKKVANQFLQGEEDVDNAVVRDIIKRLDSYKEAFAHVARQLEAGGYDTATIANRMSGKAVAEFAEGIAEDVVAPQAARRDPESPLVRALEAAASAAGGVTRVQIEKPEFTLRDYLWSGTLGVVGFVGQAMVVLFIAYFLLAAGDSFRRKMVTIAGPSFHPKGTAMIGYVTLGTNDLPRATAFYDALLAGPASVESAFCAARNRLFTTHAGTTPLDYLRGTDGSFRARGGKSLGPVINSSPAMLCTPPRCA